MIRKSLLILFILFCSISHCLPQSFCFEAPLSYSFAYGFNYFDYDEIVDIDMIDFNNDQMIDVVLYVKDNDRLYIYTGNGKGQFFYDTYLPTGEKIDLVETGDFNLDGYADIMISVEFSPEDYILFGPNWFGHDVTLHSWRNTLKDINQDGIEDLIGIPKDDGFTVSFGDISDPFASYTYYAQSRYCFDIAVDDLNLDGKQDIVTANDSGYIEIYFGDGSGAFSFMYDMKVDSTEIVSIQEGDFNNDGFADIIAGSLSQVKILLNDGTGTNFTVVQDCGIMLPKIDIENYHEQIETNDLNDDNILDIVMGTASMVDVFLGMGNGTFHFHSRHPVGKEIIKLLSEDINGDNLIDIISASEKAGVFSVLLGDSTQLLKQKGIYADAISPYSFCAADFNNDQKVDIVSASTLLDSTIEVFVQSDPDSFILKQKMGHVESVGYLVSHDLNNDSNIDLAAIFTFSDEMEIYFNDGTGIFSDSFNISLPYQPSRFTIGDFNTDLLDDIAVSYGSNHFVSILLNNGNNGFIINETFSTLYQIYRIESADFNGDSILDLIFVSSSENIVTLLLGSGNGTFSSASYFPVTKDITRLLVMDFDKDTDNDLVMSISDSPGVYLFKNDGGGNFLLYDSLDIENWGGMLAKADFDENGWDDIVVHNSAGMVHVFMADSTGYHTDKINVTSYWVNHYFYPADVDNDGKMDLMLADGQQIFVAWNKFASSITSTGATICNGSPVTLTGSEAFEYLWSTGETTQSIIIDEPGSYTVTISNFNESCSLVSSPVIVTNTPETPLIFQLDDTLFSNSVSGNQWYNLSGAITGATEAFFVATEPGTYYVVVTDSNGCISEPSASITILFSSIAPLQDEVLIYPNPASSVIAFSSPGGLNKIDALQIYDSRGVLVHDSKQVVSNQQINVLSWMEGLYYYRLNNTYEGSFAVIH